MELILLSLISFFVLIYFVLRYKKRDQNMNDSALKQRRILNYNEQLLLKRLNMLLPECTVLCKVSYDALLTTKYEHTRQKFHSMTADFVLLNARHEVMMVIALYDPVLGLTQQLKSGQYENQLLTSAGYAVVSYIGVPDERKLAKDLNINSGAMAFA
ncbi:DUF2726 domain-containing protein [Acinetobacter sp. MD2(2019)]|uniref:DUF2726 domain-containing protein n=1 Tax=Acinetobacter sp. MD2(2019) TaxID=2605273 RepID=UPI002D1F0C95|nr:DUF2726 domain-containing protein [Acinetobacter sp. MD2(2019)]MEB3755004.1 DUF2726 domain-containing protein [Acinetobacter sp. MD2(2019)]